MKMYDRFWIFSRSEPSLGLMMMLMTCLLYQNLGLCCSLNQEGLALLKVRDRVTNDPFGALSNWNDKNGDLNPCSWSGVECNGGKVVVVNLRDLCLGGTLAPELGELSHVKAIILRNNSFYGVIPEEIGELNELEVLDLGYNNFRGLLPISLGNNLSLTILLVDNNDDLSSSSPRLDELQKISESQVDENQLSHATKRSICRGSLSKWKSADIGSTNQRMLLQGSDNNPRDPNVGLDPVPLSPSPSPSPLLSPTPSPSESPSPPPFVSAPPSAALPAPPSKPSPPSSHGSSVFIWVGVAGGFVLLLILGLGIFFWKGIEGHTVKPWATGLSGQLQKAFVTGVPNLKRSELETACEDFSNVIGTSSLGTVYKGTLSSGVEIAVTSIAVKSSSDWSKNLEAQFRKKIDMLSKVNHKNFVNLIGYCEEEAPFSRMMVFEYAPNGTLFEHLHVKESEYLDWGMRLRIAMGMAYCLDYMHQYDPPITLKNLNSSAVSLTEDYAAKISDFTLWNDSCSSERKSAEMEMLSESSESNVYSFSLILLEIITGRFPYSVANGSLEDWAVDCLTGEKHLKEIVDPTLGSFQEEQVEAIGEIIRSCLRTDLSRRPTMREVTSRLSDITMIGPDAATPRLSPLWWAELEILSTEAS